MDSEPAERVVMTADETTKFKAELAECRLAEEELLLTKFSVDHAAIPAYLIGKDGRFLYANERGCRALGYTSEELLAMTVADVDPDFSSPRWQEHWAELKREGSLHFETTHRRKDGQVFPVDVVVNFLDYSGREYNWAFVRDITERRAAENELKHSYQVTRTILDSMNDAISLIDVRDFRIAGVNSVFLQEYGYADEAEVTGKFCFEVTHGRADVCAPPDDICPLVETLRTGEHFSVEHVHYGRQGEKIYVEVSTSPIKDENGKVIQVVHVARNITARKAAEEALKRSEQRFRDIAEHAGEWIWEVDADGRYTYASPVVKRILGYAPEEVLGRHFYDFFHPVVKEELTRKAFDVFARREAFEDFENLNLDREDRTVILATSGVPILSEVDGQLLGYRGVDRDITLRKQAEEELRISEARFRSFFEQSTLSMQTFAPDGQSLEVNRAWERLWGIKSDDVRYYNVLEDSQLESKGIAPYIRKGFAGEATEIPAVRFDPGEIGISGRSRWVQAFIYPVKDEMNRVRQVVLMHLDITDQVLAEEAIRESENRLAMAQKAGGVGVFDWDLISGKVVWTELMEELFGLAPGTFEGTYEGWFQFVHPEDRLRVEGQFQQWMQEQVAQVEFQYRILRIDGRTRWMTVGAQFSYLADGTPSRMLGTCIDVTERKEMEEIIRHQAFHDVLTGLPNRRLFVDIVNLELARAKRNGTKFAVLFLDLDRFKYINDALGHGIGDELLKEVAGRLKHSVRESDSVARIGGDEFNILLGGITHTGDIIGIAGKVIDSFRKPYVINGHRLQAATSIGISIYPEDALDIEDLFSNADMAMYHAKEMGGNSYQFYDQTMNIRTLDRMRLEGWLQQSIRHNELEVYYQPMVATDSCKITCIEALVRWHHPEQGFLEPGQFLPLAEETGFITAIDEWVLRTACAQLKEWQQAGMPDICIAVNLSARQFQKADLAERIALILEKTGIDPSRLSLEITESTAMGNLERTITPITKLADMGIGIGIDDFGTGYSSLSCLKKLPLHKVKIDKSFVNGIATDVDDRTIIKAVTALAQNMQLRVVAEGVETGEQLEFLRSIDCQEMQGNLFSRPLPAAEMAELITSRGFEAVCET
jgi:diguanylate cyclase (GGDEF)-like protein/PAS domain S-box-containing protein